MKKLISVFAITALLVGCGKNVKSNNSKSIGFDVSNNKGISKIFSVSEELILHIKDKSLSRVTVSLSDGADPNYLSFDGERPLVVAAKVGDIPIVRELLARGADADLEDAEGKLPIFEALKQKNVEVLKMIIDKSKNLNVLNKNNESALIAALKSQNVNMAKVLIKAGINTKIKDKQGRRAIEISRSKNISVINSLLINVAKINSKGLDDYFITKAIKENDIDTLDYIYQNFPMIDFINGSNIIDSILTLNNDDKTREMMLDYFIERGMSVEGEPNDSSIPLIQAAKARDHTTVKKLLDNGADPNKIDKLYNSALVYAIRALNPDIVEELKINSALLTYTYEVNGRTYLKDSCKIYKGTKRRGMSNEKKTRRAKIKSKLDC